MSRKIVNPSAIRNRGPILEILKKHINLEKPGLLLEIASGTGTHLEHFAPNLPNVTYQPSEFDAFYLDSIKVYSAGCQTTNILAPLQIDVRTDSRTWGNLQPKSVSYMININMIHISEFACTEGLFRAAGELLEPGGLLFTYGPYAENGVLSPESNVRFDASLKSQNPTWGVRDIRDLEKVAAQNLLSLIAKYEMPANNKTLVWQRE